MTIPKLTPTLQKFYDLMADGYRHRLVEFRNVMEDEFASEDAIAMLISRLRKEVRLLGEDITCERENKAKTYRRVRTLQGNGE